MADAPSAFGEPAGSEDAHIRTFLIADVRGYTVFTQERGDEAAALLATKFAQVARDGVEARRGTVVELRGDEALAVFDSARQAIRAAVELQRRFVDETIADPTLPLAVGIGLDAGEAVAVGDGFRGGALNLAARLCSIAGPGESLASPAVTHLARKVDGVVYVDRGPVTLKGLADPVQVIRLRAEAGDAADDVAFRRALGSAGVRLAPADPGAIVANPYKGLRAFEEADAADFFGREELVDLLVERLAGTRFLAVVGPSGSGKSSVVRAGLVPALRRGAIPGSERWPIVDMFPGPKPLDGLEAALLRAHPDAPPAIMDELERDEHGLHRAVLRLVPRDRSDIVLVIDQFEEVFTLVEDEAARAHFLGSLEAAVTDPHSRLRVVVTLRGDFYDRPLLYRGFAELFTSRVEAVIPLSAEELERAISEPARRVDVALEPRLIAAMLADVAEEPGGLPLMEYALTELFDRRDGRVLTLDAYREIGGVRGALGRRAEELFEDLDDAGKEAARQVFLRLVTLGEGSEDTRRRALREEVDSLTVDRRSLMSMLEAYGAARLLSFDRDARTGAPTVELAHEAILTAWPRLHRWIDAARDDVRTERRLASASKEWVDADRDPSFLLAGPRLEQAETWRAGSGVAATPQELEYIGASRAEDERRRAVEATREERERELERRSVRRLRAIVAVLAAAALVAGGLTIYASGQAGRAERERRTATARELAAASVANLEVDPERSILLALAAIEETYLADGTVLPEAGEALHRAVTTSRVVVTVSDEGGALDWSPRGVFVTEGPEDSGVIAIRDATTGRSVRTWSGHGIDVNDVQFSPDGSMLATVGDDGVLKVWDPETGTLRSSVAGEGYMFGPSFDADGSRLSASWSDGTVRVVDPATGEEIQAIEGLQGPLDTSLSPDGLRVAVSSFAIEEVWVFDVRTGEPLFDLRGHRYPVNWVAWSPDGRHIATAANDSTAKVWDAETGRLEADLLGHTASVISVDWHPTDPHLLVTGSVDGTAKVWRVGETDTHEVLSLGAQEMRSGTTAAFSPDGTHVITGDAQITAAKIWDLGLTGSAEVSTVPTDELAPVDVAFLDDEHFVAPTDRGSVAVWDAASGRRLRTIGPGTGSNEPVVEIDVGADGSRIAILRNFSSTATVWDPTSGKRLLEVRLGSQIGAIDMSDDGERLLAWAFEGNARLFDGDGATLQDFRVPPGLLMDTAALSDDGRLVAAGARRPESPRQAFVTIWDARTGEPIVERLPTPGAVRALAFDPSASSLAVARADGKLAVWEIGAEEPRFQVDSDAGPVFDLAWSPDGSRLAIGAEDATIRLYDAEDGEQQLVLRAHGFLVSGVAFSPDGSRLASASRDATVRVWALDLQELTRIAAAKLTRGLTLDECRQYLHLEGGCP